VSPYQIVLDSSRLQTYNTLRQSLQTAGVETILVFCKITQFGGVHITAPEQIELQDRLNYIEAILAALPPRYRSRITFTTSSTSPQNIDATHIVFVDAGTPIAKFAVTLTKKATLNARPAGLRYILRIDDIANGRFDAELQPYIHQLRIPHSISTDPAEMGRQLDLVVEFADAQLELQLALSDAPTPPHTSHLAQELLLKYTQFLSDAEKILLFERAVVSLSNDAQVGINPKLDIRIKEAIIQQLDLAGANVALIASSRSIAVHFHQTLVTNVAFVLSLSENIESFRWFVGEFRERNFTATYLMRVLPLVLFQVIQRLIKHPTVAATELWDLSYKTNWLSSQRLDHLLGQLLNSEYLRIPTLLMIVKQADPIRTFMQFSRRMEILGASLPFSYNFILTILERDAQPAHLYDLLDRSYEELGGVDAWLYWGAEQLLRSRKYTGIDEVGIRVLSADKRKGHKILASWCESWQTSPEQLSLLTDKAQLLLFDFTLQQWDLQFAFLLVWKKYVKLVLDDNLSMFYLGSPLRQQLQTLLSNFRGSVSTLIDLCLSSKPDNTIQKILFVCELLDETDQLQDRLVQQYLVQYLDPRIPRFYFAIARRVIKHASEDYLRRQMQPNSKSAFTIATPLLAVDDVVLAQFALLSSASQGREEKRLFALYTKEVGTFIVKFFGQTSLQYQEMIVVRFNEFGLGLETDVAHREFRRNERKYKTRMRLKKMQSTMRQGILRITGKKTNG